MNISRLKPLESKFGIDSTTVLYGKRRIYCDKNDRKTFKTFLIWSIPEDCHIRNGEYHITNSHIDFLNPYVVRKFEDLEMYRNKVMLKYVDVCILYSDSIELELKKIKRIYNQLLGLTYNVAENKLVREEGKCIFDMSKDLNIFFN